MTATQSAGAATRISSIFSVVLGFLAILIASGDHLLGIILGLISVLFVAVGVVTAGRNWIAAGTLILVVSIVLATFESESMLPGLVGLGLAFVAWDCGEYAIGLGKQVGRNGVTARQELRNTGINLAVAIAGVGVGWGTLTLSLSDIPIFAIIPLAVGCLFLIAVLRS